MPDSKRPEGAAPSVDTTVARAKHLPLAPRPVVDLVPARMINELVYCERLMALEWVQGEFADNVFTVEGRAVHARADQPAGALGATETNAEGESLPYTARSVWLSSEELGLTAKIDIVEGDRDGRVTPIEYKRGKPPDVPEGAHLPERAQLAAQVMLLRAHGYTCDRAEIYFAAAKRRVEITIDDALLETVRQAVIRAREIATSGVLPPPLVHSPKCDGCSLIGICLPDETVALNEAPSPDPIRHLHPPQDHRLPLYVTEAGARLGLDGEELVVRGKEGETRASIGETSHISLFGNVQISSQAMRRLMELDIGVTFLSSGGWLSGRAEGLGSKNVALRIAQHRAASEAEICRRLARAFVEAKIRNCRTLLRRNHPDPPAVTLFELEQFARKAQEAESIESLLGIEGTAARAYFGAFTGMLKSPTTAFDLDGRNRRPPRDPVNALLSFCYSMLARDVTVALGNAGLDPMVGFYHQPRAGRPSLALDVMEELRPTLADSVVITAINNGVVGERDFLIHPNGVSLKPGARKAMIYAWERRLDQLVTHPVFGYRISQRRILEVQARLLGRYLLGEIPDYPQLRPR
jgi:CRISPR-associated protein Cas1